MAETLAILKGRTFLLGVGAQKAGTTWLSYYLHAHPEVMMSPIKEMHFFGNRLRDDPWPIPMFRKKLARLEAIQARNPEEDTRSFAALKERIRMGKDARRYRRFFRKRVTDEPVFGEITPAYCFLDAEEFAFIRSEYPSTKVIFLLRNPADRMWSQMRFSEKFDDLDQLEARVAGAFDKPVYFERYDYVRTIRNLRASFAPANIHFEFYERLFTPEAIERICRFLDISIAPANFDRTRNVSIKMPLSPELRGLIVEKLAPQYQFCRDIFAGDLPQSWLDDLELL